METSPTLTEDLDPALKLALAMAIVQSRRHPNLTNAASADCHSDSVELTDSDALRWKKKAKQRKEEILRLREDLKIAQEEMQRGVYPASISCKCYFYDDLLHPSRVLESESGRFEDVLRRRFLRQVRLSERRKKILDGPSLQNSYDTYRDNEIDLLQASVDLLVDFCENYSRLKVEDGYFKSLSHQATDFILATLKSLSVSEVIHETIESIVSCLIMRLVKGMCGGAQGHEFLPSESNLQLYIQHLMRKLGSDPNVGQRIIISVSQRISMAAESLFYMDPFDAAFLRTQQCLYLMIQLIDFLISDYLLSWPASPKFDSSLLEEWVASVAVAQKSLELLEKRNSLYMLYMQRLVGELTRNLGQAPFTRMIGPDFLKIFT